MGSPLGNAALLTDSDLDALAVQFLNSPYADRNKYSEWPLDRRIEGFLLRRGLVRLAEDGDAYGLILDRVMAYLGAAHRRGPGTGGRADERPRRPGTSVPIVGRD
ncbi:hypothetical protein PJM51_20400 [Mycobacterium kansasii]